MEQQSFNIAGLLAKYLREELVEEEQQQLDQWISASPGNEELFKELMNYNFVSSNLSKFYYYNEDSIAKQVGLKIPQLALPQQISPPVRRIHFMQAIWFRAAVIILIVLSGILIYHQFSKTDPSKTSITVSVPDQPAILPGTLRATLTLSDGKNIELNSAASETITDGNLAIKNNNGQLVYGSLPIPSYGGVAPGGANSSINPSGPGAGVGRGATLSNTMTTPRGGQYQLILPDGSRVWLNAASSITYPTTFTKAIREVTITGEAYFEITKNKTKPFIVSFKNTKVEVLGTSFNINAYEDEPVATTTLAEGAVSVQHPSGRLLLQQGEQAVINKTLSLNKKANIRQTLSWKNGLFNFRGQDFAASMRQIERWYDVRVVYDNGIPQQELWGSAYRSLTLERIIKGLEGPEVHFRLEGRILHVMP